MTDDQPVPGLLQIGETLRAAREGRGLSLDQAAARLRCDVRVVESLEAGRFADVGPPVFARGHLLRYAELLGESGEAMLSDWTQSAEGSGAAGELLADQHPRRVRDLRQVRRRLVAGTALLCTVIVATWGLQQLGPRSRAATEPGAAPAAATQAAAANPDAAAAAAGPPAPSNATVAPEAATPGEAVTATGTAAAAPAAAEVRQPVAPTPAAAAASAPFARLAVTASAETWLEIYDRRNRRLFFGVARPGAMVDVRGGLPLRVVVGNVPAATFELDGRRLEVPREAMRGRRAATFRVGLDGRPSAAPRA